MNQKKNYRDGLDECCARAPCDLCRRRAGDPSDPAFLASEVPGTGEFTCEKCWTPEQKKLAEEVILYGGDQDVWREFTHGWDEVPVCHVCKRVLSVYLDGKPYPQLKDLSAAQLHGLYRMGFNGWQPSVQAGRALVHLGLATVGGTIASDRATGPRRVPHFMLTNEGRTLFGEYRSLPEPEQRRLDGRR